MTSAQARDLTYGRHELRTPIRSQAASHGGLALQDSPPGAAPSDAARPKTVTQNGAEHDPPAHDAQEQGGRQQMQSGQERGAPDGAPEPGILEHGVPEPGILEHGVPEPADPVGLAGAQSQLLLVADPESVKVARDFTVATLRGWQLEALIDEGVIIASELVTNAIRHGGCLASSGHSDKVELSWRRDAGRVICAVTDGSSMPPAMAAADMSAESGRGLHVVHALAASWGWTMVGAQEKAVWAVLPLP